MVYCSKCGKENDEDSKYCSNCGNSLTDSGEKDSVFEKKVEDFASTVERVGKKAGKKIEVTSKRFEKATERAEKRLENWYDQTFGIFGPLVFSFIGLIIIRLVIVGFKIGAEDTPILGIIGDKLLDYLLLIFIVFLISNYCSYISRKYKPFRWVSPIFVAIVIVIVSMIVATIITTIGISINEPYLINAEEEWREKYMFMIFVIVLLIGYLINVATVAWEKDQKR